MASLLNKHSLPLRGKIRRSKGQVLIELLVAIGASVILIPAIFSGIASSREGKVQQRQRLLASSLAESALEAVRVVREADWENVATNGVFHPVISGNTWALVVGTEDILDFTRSLTISDVHRDLNENIADSGVLDPSIKKVVASVSWTNVVPSSVEFVMYLTRYVNALFTHTLTADFDNGLLIQTQVTSTSGGEIKLANNNKAKWCSPEFSSATIDLPDGPPIAVSAAASSVNNTFPNDAFVATSPSTSSSIKLAYVNVTANSDPPVPTQRGIFTLDIAQYSNPSYFPSGIGLDNNFKTNDVKYYKSPSGKVYALLATNLPGKEVVVVQINDGALDSYQDPVNKIYKYWTFFNTRRYQGNSSSLPNQDQAPFDYGAVTMTVLENRGYIASGGYMYVIDLSNIDSKSPASGLDMVGCRIQLDGYDCQPGNGTNRKYDAGQTGASWGDTTSPAHSDCSDGGNIELYATNQLSAVKVGSSNYIMAAVGAGTNPELNIVNATSVPTGGTSPSISSNSCGRISGGNSGWRRISSLDFNSQSGTEEAANSVYVRPDGTRVYMSSNGGVDGNDNGIPDSHQFYVINTSNKSSPSFLSGSPSTGATSGYYNGDATNIQLFPRRSLTVLNGLRAIIVGQDGFQSDSTDPKDYQVLNIETEATPTFCSGLDFNAGFNDLTSVSEADLDNFVYMVANTEEKQLKIIQGGPDDGIYIDAGTFESEIVDAGRVANFNRFTSTQTLPAGTSIRFQVGVVGGASATCSSETYSYVGPDGTGATYFTTTTGKIPFASTDPNFTNPGRCFRYKAYLATTDTSQTPVLEDFQVNYSP